MNASLAGAESRTHQDDGETLADQALTAGSMVALDHGIAELTLPDQVRAVTEAPAVLTLVDGRTIRLDRGRAFFEVPTPEGRGLTVVTQEPYGVKVTADHLVSDTVAGKLVAVDVPCQPTLPVAGPFGPDWPEAADSGWRMRVGSNLEESSRGQSPWEPDGTPLTEAQT
jgi:hypothetical protein